MKLDITVCTTFYDDGTVPSLVTSCRKWVIPLTTFGTERKFEGFLKTKMIPLRDFLRTVKTKYVMFLDGNDTFFVVSLDAVMRTYFDMVGSKHKYVIGSEHTCWPYRTLASEMLTDRARATGTSSPFCFLDLGLVIGETEALVDAFNRVVASAEPYAKLMPEVPRYILEDDVGLWMLNILEKKVDPLIDYDCRIMIALRKMDWGDFSFRDGRLYSKLTDSWPHIIHCNGRRSIDRKTFRHVHEGIFGKSDKGYRKITYVNAEGYERR